jgi:hypothetical protein
MVFCTSRGSLITHASYQTVISSIPGNLQSIGAIRLRVINIPHCRTYICAFTADTHVKTPTKVFTNISQTRALAGLSSISSIGNNPRINLPLPSRSLSLFFTYSSAVRDVGKFRSFRYNENRETSNVIDPRPWVGTLYLLQHHQIRSSLLELPPGGINGAASEI